MVLRFVAFQLCNQGGAVLIWYCGTAGRIHQIIVYSLKTILICECMCVLYKNKISTNVSTAPPLLQSVKTSDCLLLQLVPKIGKHFFLSWLEQYTTTTLFFSSPGRIDVRKVIGPSLGSVQPSSTTSQPASQPVVRRYSSSRKSES